MGSQWAVTSMGNAYSQWTDEAPQTCFRSVCSGRYGGMGRAAVSLTLSLQVYDSPVDMVGIPHGVSKAVSQNPVVQKTVEASLHLYMAVNKKAVEQYLASANRFKASLPRRQLPGTNVWRQQNPMLTPTHVFYSAAGDPVADPQVVENVVAGWKALDSEVSS